MNKASISSLILKLKNLDEPNTPFYIPIFDNDNKQIGLLSPITQTLSSNPDIIQKLTKWRRMFMRYFLTQFQATEKRTADWLEKIVIPSTDRILFLILDKDENIIGNFGVSNLSTNTAELDNLIRGEKGGHPKLVYYAELSLLNWLYHYCNIQIVNLHVFSNNPKTINLHSNVGFKIIGETVLYKTIHDQEIRYSINPPGEIANFYYVEMRFSKEDFQVLHSQNLESK